MEILSLLLALILGLVLGALVGAWLMWRRAAGGGEEARRAQAELAALRTEHQGAREELAAARAEQRALTAARAEDAERQRAESQVMSTLAPLGQRLAAL